MKDYARFSKFGQEVWGTLMGTVVQVYEPKFPTLGNASVDFVIKAQYVSRDLCYALGFPGADEVEDDEHFTCVVGTLTSEHHGRAYSMVSRFGHELMVGEKVIVTGFLKGHDRGKPWGELHLTVDNYWFGESRREGGLVMPEGGVYFDII